MRLSIAANWSKESNLERVQLRTALWFPLITSLILTTSCGPSANVDSRAADIAALQRLDEQWSATAARNDLLRGPSRSMPMTQCCFLPTHRSPQTGSRSVNPGRPCSVRTRPCLGRFPKAKWVNPANSGTSTEPTNSLSRIRREVRQSTIRASLSKSGRSRETESGNALWIRITLTSHLHRLLKHKGNGRTQFQVPDHWALEKRLLEGNFVATPYLLQVFSKTCSPNPAGLDLHFLGSVKGFGPTC